MEEFDQSCLMKENVILALCLLTKYLTLKYFFLFCNCLTTIDSTGQLETFYVDQADLKIKEIYLPLPEECILNSKSIVKDK